MLLKMVKSLSEGFGKPLLPSTQISADHRHGHVIRPSVVNSRQPCQGRSETQPLEHLVLTQPLQDKTAPHRSRLSLAMSLTGDLYLEHKENYGNSIINRQMRTALSEQRHQGRVHFEKVLISCKRNSRTQQLCRGALLHAHQESER